MKKGKGGKSKKSSKKADAVIEKEPKKSKKSKKSSGSSSGITTELTLDKVTPGTYRFADSENDDAEIPTLYIKKTAFKKDPPDSVKIVVTW